MKVTAAAASDVGLVREGNEDSYLTLAPLFAVADGMGGHRGGEVASQLAVETLQRTFREGQGELPDQIQEANRAVFERSVTDRQVAGMGTTLTVALLEDDRIRLAHVGDSRAYLLRSGELSLLTEDHTLVHRMVQEGEISEEEAETHPQRSVLTRALGVDIAVEVDDETLVVQPGDRLMLCTDGLTSMVRGDEIERILRDARSPAEAAEQLVRAANRAGGADNTTVVVLDLLEDDQPGTGSSAVTGSVKTETAGSEPSAGPLPQERGRTRARRRLPWARIGLWTGIVAVVAIAALLGLRMYVDTQWYVGVSNGHVAVFRGIPTEVGGFRLHHVVVETDISAAVAESLAVYRDLSDGITADTRERAAAIVERIRNDVDKLQHQAGGGSSPSSPKSTPSP
jgi:serine/threonine protein phosphatase PrpC